MTEPLRMLVDHEVHCSGPGCEVHQHMGHSTYETGRLPIGWVRLVEYSANGQQAEAAFCQTECAMKWCATKEPPTIIDGDFGGSPDG